MKNISFLELKSSTLALVCILMCGMWTTKSCLHHQNKGLWGRLIEISWSNKAQMVEDICSLSLCRFAFFLVMAFSSQCLQKDFVLLEPNDYEEQNKTKTLIYTGSFPTECCNSSCPNKLRAELNVTPVWSSTSPPCIRTDTFPHVICPAFPCSLCHIIDHGGHEWVHYAIILLHMFLPYNCLGFP